MLLIHPSLLPSRCSRYQTTIHCASSLHGTHLELWTFLGETFLDLRWRRKHPHHTPLVHMGKDPESTFLHVRCLQNFSLNFNSYIFDLAKVVKSCITSFQLNPVLKALWGWSALQFTLIFNIYGLYALAKAGKGRNTFLYPFVYMKNIYNRA